MADAFYTLGRAALQAGSINWVSDPIGVALVSAIQYRFSAVHQFYSSISSAVLAFGILPGRTDDAGSVAFDETTLLGLETTQVGHALVFYHETFDESTSTLISYHDSTIGLPTAPDGNPLYLVCPHGPERLFNYTSGAFGQWEGVWGRFQSAGSVAACQGALSRNLAF